MTMNHEQVFGLNEVVEHARKHSPYYRDLYCDLPEEGWALTDLPIIDQKEYWEANSTLGENTVLVEHDEGGIVFKSGGTTGAPKHSVFTRNEWATMCHALGIHFGASGYQDGDRVANLFYGGNLYASFLYAYHTLMETPVRVEQYPLSGAADNRFIVETLREFDINVLAGVPTTLMELVEYIEEENVHDVNLKRMFFGGETFYTDQRQRVRELFPDIEISSIGLASVDAGFLAFAGEDCGFNEHRVMPDYTILEIVCPDTGDVIDGVEEAGIIVATNLTRKRMPIIRYPIGDRGMWREPAGTDQRKFVLLGRTEAGARVGPATVYVSDVVRILQTFGGESPFSNFQLLITHEDGLDRLTLKIVASGGSGGLDELEKDIVARLLKERKMLDDLIAERLIHPVEVEWVDRGEMVTNPRTGKCRRVIDRRVEKDLETHNE